MHLTGNILAGDTWIPGKLVIRDGLISSIETSSCDMPANAPRLLPGFIDLHVHGGGGADIMQGGEAARVLAQVHAQYGTTSLLATTMTARMDDIAHALAAIAAVMKKSGTGADIMGVHLEGPFINPERLGAQPDHVVRASRSRISRLLALAPVRVITLAPEFPENLEIIPWLTAQDIRVQIGHTLADYGQCVCALASGARSFTHLYNAMSPLHHRAAGTAGAALAHGFHCEIIPDLVHTDKGAILTAMRAIPRLYGISDGTAACGMPDGQYRLGENHVLKKGGAVRLKNGTLAGSALTLDQALRNFIMLGDSPARASKRLSEYPADYLGLTDRGRLLPGLRADINVMDANFHLVQTYVAGERVRNRNQKQREKTA